MQHGMIKHWCENTIWNMNIVTSNRKEITRGFSFILWHNLRGKNAHSSIFISSSSYSWFALSVFTSSSSSSSLLSIDSNRRRNWMTSIEWCPPPPHSPYLCNMTSESIVSISCSSHCSHIRFQLLHTRYGLEHSNALPRQSFVVSLRCIRCGILLNTTASINNYITIISSIFPFNPAMSQNKWFWHQKPRTLSSKPEHYRSKI